VVSAYGGFQAILLRRISARGLDAAQAPQHPDPEGSGFGTTRPDHSFFPRSISHRGVSHPSAVNAEGWEVLHTGSILSKHGPLPK
jgi:hypothetical protein